MTEANRVNEVLPGSDSVLDTREAGTQLRPGLWQTINDRFPGLMITKSTVVPLARLMKPLSASRLIMISSCGVHLKTDRPLDVFHPLGDFGFRRVPSRSNQQELTIHHIKFPHDDADLDINVIFPIERLREMVEEKVLGGLTENFLSFIGYNMDMEKFERTTARDIAEAAVVQEKADAALLVPA
jgi:D-proline reductase (dithiol) PrdB